MNKQWFKYLFKTKKTSIIFFGLIYFFMLFINYTDSYYSPLIFGATLSIIISIILPIMMLRFVHNRNSSDVYLSMPISRRQLLVTNLVFVNVLSIGFYYITNFILYFMDYHNDISGQEFIICLLSAALIFITISLYTSFLYLRANNELDGLVMIVAYYALPFVAVFVLANIYDILVVGYQFNIDDTIINWILHCSPLYLSYRVMGSIFNTYDRFAYLSVICLILFSLYSMVGLKFLFINRKSERSNQISNEWYGYPLVINLYLVICLSLISVYLASDGEFVSCALLLIILLFVYIIAQFVYRRRIKIEVKSILIFVGTFFITFLIGTMAWKTHCFGISDHWNLYEGDTLTYIYQDYLTEYGTDVAFELVIPVDKKDKYEEAIKILEKNRVQAVNDFYSGNHTYGSSLQIFNSLNKKRINNYNYSGVNLDESELKTIEKYTKVIVSTYDYDNGKYESFDYSEYLKNK